MRIQQQKRWCRRTVVLGLLAAPLVVRSAKADAFPSRPIKLIVPFGPGGTADIIARKVSSHASDQLKQSIVVENRPGAGGSVGAAAVASAPPDGYTICLGTVASHAIAGAMQKQRYDLATSFRALSILVASSGLIVVNKDVPVKTLPEYLEWARRKGNSPYTSGGVATTTQLLPELIRARLNVPLSHIPASKVGDAFNDLVAGRVDMMCYSAIGLQPYLEAGFVRPVAAASTARIKHLPDLPTVSEVLGSSEYNMPAWFGTFAPAKTPDNVVNVLSSALSSGVITISGELEKIGAEALGWDAQRSDTFFQSEIPRWAEIVRLTGVMVQN